MFLPKSVESSREALRHSSPKDFDTSDAKQTPRTVPDSSFSESAIDDYASSPALVDEYRISAREVEQRVLPPVVDAGAAASCPGYTPGLTKIFAYGTVTSNGKSTHSWPAYTIEARVSCRLCGCAFGDAVFGQHVGQKHQCRALATVAAQWSKYGNSPSQGALLRSIRMCDTAPRLASCDEDRP